MAGTRDQLWLKMTPDCDTDQLTAGCAEILHSPWHSSHDSWKLLWLKFLIYGGLPPALTEPLSKMHLKDTVNVRLLDKLVSLEMIYYETFIFDKHLKHLTNMCIEYIS